MLPSDLPRTLESDRNLFIILVFTIDQIASRANRAMR